MGGSVKSSICPTCGSKMKRNGKTSAGTQRWRCKECGSSSSHHHDVEARNLATFVSWLLSNKTQKDMPGNGRTFRRMVAKFWKIWPMPEIVDEIHRVIFVDGIWIAKDLVVLIACSEKHVLSWYLARSENSLAWRALLSRIASPDMVVTDGGTGFAKAVRAEWPTTKVQRCIFHAFCQVRRYTTTHPRLQAGIELYVLAKELLNIKTLKEADWWTERFLQWCEFWSDFLEEKSYIDGRWEFTHERLRKARRSLVVLVNKGTLFTYLDPSLAIEEALPATTNRIEGGINAQLRIVLKNHRGLSDLKRVKAVFWWCYMHVECPKSMAETLHEMPTDEDIEMLQKTFGENKKNDEKPQKWGTGLVWSEFHNFDKFPHQLE